MKNPTHNPPMAVRWAALFAALAAFVPHSQAQVTFQQVTNGLIDYYPLDLVVTNNGTYTTPDYISGRDMIMNNMNGANLIAAGHPTLNPASTNKCMNFPQTPAATLLYYVSKGQSALDGSGDFLPFCNQLNASMSFWMKCVPTTGYNDTRFFGECDNSSGASGPIWLWGTSSGGGLGTDTHAHFLFRENSGSTAGPETLTDGTKQLPNLGYYWVQGNSYTAANPLDGSWHMLTMTIDTNRVIDFYVDGVRDAGPGSVGGTTYTDANGNPNWGPDMPLTNLYYTTNIYGSTGVSNPPPNGFVRWMWNATFKTGVTAFGGFKRNAALNAGIPCQMDDIAFWNRKLDTNEIMFVYTNGLPGIQIQRPLLINSFTADFAEVGAGDTVTLRGNVTGRSTNTGGLVISGVGDVSSKGLIGSTNVPVAGDKSFTLTAHSGYVPDITATVSVKTFAGVASDWHLIQRFDGLFADTDPGTHGISGDGWTSAGSDYRGSFDQWNVVTLADSAGTNKVLTPRNGYFADANSGTGFGSRGAMATGQLGSLSIDPGQTNTLFFRFSLKEASAGAPAGTELFSDIDFNVGVSDGSLIGPFASLVYPGNVGPQFKIYRNTSGAFSGGPFNLYAGDWSGTSSGVTNSFDYINAVNANGLQTNVIYYVWMDVENYNTHTVDNGDGTSNTVNMAIYSLWIQKQGDPARTNLFSRYHAQRDFVTYTLQDIPDTHIDKVFLDIGDEDVTGSSPGGAYIATNMIAVDDFYISKAGVKSTIPRLFDITSVAKAPSGVTLKWDSLGSLYGTNTYTIQRKSQLGDSTWTTVGTVPSGGDSTTYVDTTVGASSAAFYRISWP